MDGKRSGAAGRDTTGRSSGWAPQARFAASRWTPATSRATPRARAASRAAQAPPMTRAGARFSRARRCCHTRGMSSKTSCAGSATRPTCGSTFFRTALDREDWLEAFAAHPKIGVSGSHRPGGSRGSRRPGGSRGPAGSDWSRGKDAERWSDQEQAGVADAAEATRRRLAEANREYQARFGYIFIVCATGRTAGEMLDILERRLKNDEAGEIQLAAEEQRRITRLRLAKLLEADQDTTT